MKNFNISKNELKEINSLKQEKIFIRVAEASKIFSLSESHIWGLISKKILKAYKPSPKVTLIKKSQIIEYIEQSVEAI